MFRRIRDFFSAPKVSAGAVELELIGDDLDAALDTYAELLDNSCRDELVMLAARERIADLQERYSLAKIEHLNKL